MRHRGAPSQAASASGPDYRALLAQQLGEQYTPAAADAQEPEPEGRQDRMRRINTPGAEAMNRADTVGVVTVDKDGNVPLPLWVTC